MISKSILVLTALSSGLTSYIKYGFNTTNPTEYSFYVLIYGPSVCGGTVLSYDTVLYILSTTHCVLVSNSQSILPPPQMRIISIFDTVMFTSTIKTINPNYQQNGKLDINYDNAVFHLQNLIKKSSSVSRVALWNATIETHPAKDIGFGNIAGSHDVPPILKVLDEGKAVNTLQSCISLSAFMNKSV